MRDLSKEYGTRELSTVNIIDHLLHMMDIYKDVHGESEQHPTNLFNERLISHLQS